MSNEVATTAPTVRFGRRQSKGLLLGFSGLRLIAAGAAVAVFVPAVLLLGAPGMLLSCPVWATLLASVFVRWNGRPIVEHLPLVTQWTIRTLSGQTHYRTRPLAPRPAGTLALPGDAAALRLHIDEVTGAAMIHDPHRHTLTAVLHVTHPAYVLLAPDDQHHRVTGWGRALAGLAATGGCTVQVLESTVPDPGHGITGWWIAHGRHDNTWASREYEQLMRDTAPRASTHRTLLALTLNLHRAAPAIRAAGRGLTGAAAVLRMDMTTTAAALQAADLRCDRWLDPTELAVLLRQAYDPAAVGLTVGSPGGDLATAGPVAVDEHWDHLRHDTGYSAVLWISEWPRIDVPPSFLHSLVFLPGIRKTLCLLARPLDPAAALRQIRKEKVDYLTEAAQKTKIGRIADLSDAQEYTDVLDRERALIAGHADLRFTGLITVTAATREQLTADVAAVQRAATAAGCDTRLLHGQQAQAFTIAALPLGRTVH